MNNTTYQTTFTIPLGQRAYKLASQFQARHKFERKQRRVYLNTLAVYTVNFYCQSLGIETDLESSDSWDYINQALMNIADLKLGELGTIECIPILPSDNCFTIPDEVSSNRLGYVIVEIDEAAKEATILGYLPYPKEMKEEFTLAELADINEFLEQIYRLENGLEIEELLHQEIDEQIANNLPQIIAQLEQSLRHYPKKEESYRQFEDFLTGFALAASGHKDSSKMTRSTPDKKRLSIQELQQLARQLFDKLTEIWNIPTDETIPPDNLPKNTENSQDLLLGDYPLRLIITTETQPPKILITVKIESNNPNLTLPPGLQLSILDNEGDEVLPESPPIKDNCIKCQFMGEAGENFVIKVSLDPHSLTQEIIL